MDIFEALFTRRSIRQYTNEDVSDDDLKKILKSAMLAPSACNEQTWQFIVIRDSAGREKIAQTSPYTGMAVKAPVVIVVCGDTSKEERAKNYWVQNCSAALENMLLAARGLNLGTVWCGVHPRPEREAYVRDTLGLPDHIMPLGLVIIGHPAQPFTEAQNRFKEDRIHYEKW